MTQLRPIARDTLPGNAWPVAAARHTLDRAAPCGPPVTHSHAVVAFYTGGRTRVEQHGEWHLGEGDALLIPAGEPHRVLAADHAEFWGLGFCVPCFASDGATDLLAPFERVRDGAAAVVHIPAARRAYLEGLLRELAEVSRAAHDPKASFDAVQRSLLTLILHEVDRAAGPPPETAARGGVVAASLRFIERNCLRRLTLADVAAAVGRSPTYVTSALTRATGRSAGEWIVRGRMAEARRLLLHSDEMVDAISGRVGYADPTHFIRMFRREHGATPAAWRAAQPRSSQAPADAPVTARRAPRAPSSARR